MHEWNCVNVILFKHLQITSSCHLWSKLFRISIGILTGRIQCFSAQDQGQGHKRSCSHCRNRIVCVIFFIALCLQVGGGSDLPEREDPSNLLSEWCVCVFLFPVDVQGVCSVQM